MGQHWCKLWHEKLLASSRWRRLTVYEKGVYMEIFLRCASCDERGALRTGTRPWNLADLAMDMGADRRRVARLGKAVNRLLDEGLLGRAEDGALILSRWEALQAPSRGSVISLVGGLAKSKRV